MSNSPNKIYACDFECTTDVDYEIDGYVRCYLWHIRNIYDDADTVKGDSIEEWFAWFEKLDENCTMWFHNLAYDGSFITDHALRIGFTCEDYYGKKNRLEAKKEAELAWLKMNGKKKYEYVEGKRRKTYIPKKVTEEFSTIPDSLEVIKSGGKWITLTLVNERGFKLTIHDSGCKYTTCASLEEIAHAIGERGKSDLDVTKRRDPSYRATEEDIARVEGDTRILAKAMRLMYDRGLNSPTLAGDAWKIWHSGYINRIMAEEGCDWKEASKIVDQEIFPSLVEEVKFCDGTTVDIRDAYFGGRVYLRKKYVEKNLTGISNIDCNSMHPTQMRYMEMPYGKPWLSKGHPESDMYIVQFTCRFKVKKGMDPTIQRKESYRSVQAEWVYESDPCGEALTLTNIDLEIFLKHYDIEGWDLCEKYYVNFKHKKEEFFNDYIDTQTENKKTAKNERKKYENSDGTVKAGCEAEWTQFNSDYYSAKILMNGLYGKFGQDPEKAYQWAELENDRLRIKESDIGLGEYFSPFGHKYLPIAIFITAWSRKLLIDTFEKIPEPVYCDTDSVYYRDHGESLENLGIEIHPTKLGAWDVEHKMCDKARFLRAKTYILKGDEWVVKCGGMPIKVKEHVTWDNFHLGLEMPIGTGKLLPRRVKGGVVLKPVSYIMSD